MNKLKALWRKYRGVGSDVTRDYHDDYKSGNSGRLMLFGFEAVLVSVFVVGAAIVAATITFSGDGWPGVIGQAYALSCVNDGICDFGRLQAGLAAAIIIIVSLILLVAKVLENARLLFDAPDDDLYMAVNQIADRLDEVQERVGEISGADDDGDGGEPVTLIAEVPKESAEIPGWLDRLRDIAGPKGQEEETPW